jgi:hypothetical protein
MKLEDLFQLSVVVIRSPLRALALGALLLGLDILAAGLRACGFLASGGEVGRVIRARLRDAELLADAYACTGWLGVRA